jgi:hypothetical protein
LYCIPHLFFGWAISKSICSFSATL